MPTTKHWTSKDLETLPSTEGTRYEIIAGDLYVSTQPHGEHQSVCGVLFSVLYLWSQHTGLGRPFPAPGVIFADDEDVAPDVVWMSHARLAGAWDQAGHLTRAPELVIEVLSPGRANERRDREAKLGLYRRQGVHEYWIIDWRTQTVDVYRPTAGVLEQVTRLTRQDTLTSPLLPGFACVVGTLFAGEVHT
jgi:Uma2 family endonuclease